MGPSNIGFLSFRVIFHVHDYGRKGMSVCQSTQNNMARVCFLKKEANPQAVKAPLFLSPRNAKTLKRVFPLTTPRTALHLATPEFGLTPSPFKSVRVCRPK